MWIKQLMKRFRYMLLLLAFLPITIWTITSVKSSAGATTGGQVAVHPFLASDSNMHYIFAAASAVIFVAAAMLLFDRVSARLPILGATGIFTGTLGILLLLGIQFAANEASHETVSGNWSAICLHYVLQIIGYSYRASDYAEGNIEMQVIAFVFGVGLCEELVKVLPVLYSLRRNPQLAPADARTLGFISGIGFGVAEGIFYSKHFYNGFAGSEIYLVRFVSCVGFHGAATAIAGSLAATYHLPLTLSWRYFARLVWVISPVMLLHAIYDTFCTRSETAWALAIVFMLFGLLTYQIEASRPQLQNRATASPTKT